MCFPVRPGTAGGSVGWGVEQAVRLGSRRGSSGRMAGSWGGIWCVFCLGSCSYTQAKELPCLPACLPGPDLPAPGSEGVSVQGRGPTCVPNRK